MVKSTKLFPLLQYSWVLYSIHGTVADIHSHTYGKLKVKGKVHHTPLGERRRVLISLS